MRILELYSGIGGMHYAAECKFYICLLKEIRI